ncbi:unnamed protein product [Effrenium voratum]|nr:unnamed protein product [Effrenium voratum]
MAVPFRIHVPEEDLADLRERLARARLPDQVLGKGPGGAWAYGSDKATVQDYLTYWRDNFDWRQQEAKLNALPHFTMKVRGLQTHFIHRRSEDPEAIPLLLVHGWPGSVAEFVKVLPMLRFHVVAPSICGYGWSEAPHEPGADVEFMADHMAELMEQLGYRHFVAQGGDWGSAITTLVAARFPERCVALHLNMCVPVPPDWYSGIKALLSIPLWSREEWRGLRSTLRHMAFGTGYMLLQGTRPQSLGYGLNDSPVGLLAWFLEKFQSWSDCEHGRPEDSGISMDEILTHVMIYWTTQSITSSCRLYYETLPLHSGAKPLTGSYVTVPTGVIWAKDIFLLPRKVAQQVYVNLRHWSVQPKGGHFFASEQPKLFAEDLHRFFYEVIDFQSCLRSAHGRTPFQPGRYLLLGLAALSGFLVSASAVRRLSWRLTPACEGVLALQLDGKNGICYCSDAAGDISAWRINVPAGELQLLLKQANSHSGRILAFSLDPVSQLLLTAGADRTIRMWRLVGEGLQLVSSTSEFFVSSVLGLAYDATTGIVFAAKMQGGVKAWRHSGEALHPLPLDSEGSEGNLVMHFDAASHVMVTGGLDGSVRAWRLQQAAVKALHTQPAHQGWSRAMHYDVASGYVASCGDDGHVKAWKLEGERLQPMGSAAHAHPDGARGVLIRGSGSKMVLSCGDDGVLKAYAMKPWGLQPETTYEQNSPVFNLAYVSPTQRLLSCSMDGVLKTWQLRDHGLELEAESPDALKLPTLSMKYDPGSRTAFTAGIDGDIRVWKIEEKRIVRLSAMDNAHEGTIRSLQYDRPSRVLVSAGEDGSLRAWRLKDGELRALATLREALACEIHAIAYHGPSRVLVVASADTTLSVWEMAGKSFRQSFKVDVAHENVINAMHMDGESMTLFTGCHSIRFWHLAESKLIELHCLMYPFGRSLSPSRRCASPQSSACCSAAQRQALFGAGTTLPQIASPRF